ncbi:MAG: hypothetical protein ACWGMZ_01530 [Thermoguttaceae bacterium]
MGLEAVELVLAIEEEFGISIPDNVATHTRTLGQLHDYLLEHCAGRKSKACPTRTAFYRLRRGLGAVFGVDTKSLRPRISLLPLMGRRSAFKTWMRLQQELSLTLPPLEDQTGIGVFGGMSAGAVAGFLIATACTGDAYLGLGMGLMSLLPGTLLGFIIGVFLPQTVGKSYGTLGDLARGLVAFNYEHFVPSDDTMPTKDDPIWDRLCDVLVRELAVRKESLHRGTKFVEDLGL